MRLKLYNFVWEIVANIVEKGENAGSPAFSLFFHNVWKVFDIVNVKIHYSSEKGKWYDMCTDKYTWRPVRL